MSRSEMRLAESFHRRASFQDLQQLFSAHPVLLAKNTRRFPLKPKADQENLSICISQTELGQPDRALDSGVSYKRCCCTNSWTLLQSEHTQIYIS